MFSARTLVVLQRRAESGIAKSQSADLIHLCSHAELAIGNITRRILHMIREESEEVCRVQFVTLYSLITPADTARFQPY